MAVTLHRHFAAAILSSNTLNVPARVLRQGDTYGQVCDEFQHEPL